MRLFLCGVLVLGVSSQIAVAGEISSAYTDVDTPKTCAVFASAEEGDGDWANMICAGWRGYPVLIYAGDLRESVYYGFPPAGDLAPAWESSAAFNSTGPRIEWRIETEGPRSVPFATIHRWFVNADAQNPDRRTEVLVVAKVGQIGERDGCTVGLVLASGNPGANEAARRLADERARGFACGTDDPAMIGDRIPEFTRSRN
ncbi:hypothetical protein ABUE31_07980 [Mesorhizobium sp. ZMM04-5]|uniref:Uncharacterized protein n=1 Tax=Mesorhizobium marinum TaxID=3228790 RepID=A0ABV3QZ39_9HYPH